MNRTDQQDEILGDILKATAALKPKLRAVIKEFAAANPEYGTKGGAHDRCREASGKFCDALEAAGFKGAVVDELDVVDGVAHKAVRIGDLWIDWTARQHDPKASFPRIERDDEMLSRHGTPGLPPRYSAGTKTAADLKTLAWQFRNEQEGFFEWGEDKMCFREQCYSLSDLLAKYLTEHGIPAKPYHGTYHTDDGEEHNHWWVVAGSKIVDVTADQFYEAGEQEDYRVVITGLDDPRYAKSRS